MRRGRRAARWITAECGRFRNRRIFTGLASDQIGDGQPQTFGGDQNGEIDGAVFARREKRGLGGGCRRHHAINDGQRLTPPRGMARGVLCDDPRTAERRPQVADSGTVGRLLAGLGMAGQGKLCHLPQWQKIRSISR